MDTLDYKEPITKIYFVRHGQTNANKQGLIFGRLDWDLNTEGVNEAKRVASRLSEIKADHIIASPLVRATHTAKIIARKLKIKKIVIDKNLIEKSEGKWEGKNYWKVRTEDPKGYQNWLKNPYKNKPPGGESVVELNNRTKKFYKTILKKYSGKNIIVVGHSGPIRLFLLNILNSEINKFWHLKIENASVTEIHLSKKHAMVWTVNRK